MTGWRLEENLSATFATALRFQFFSSREPVANRLQSRCKHTFTVLALFLSVLFDGMVFDDLQRSVFNCRPYDVSQYPNFQVKKKQNQLIICLKQLCACTLKLVQSASGISLCSYAHVRDYDVFECMMTR